MTASDMELLRQYCAGRSERAFEALVARHIDLVYSSALRQVRNPHLAQEITQAVFIILARKAGSLGSRTVLAGWLYRTTRFAVANMLRAQYNRHCREQEAYMQSTIQPDPADESWKEWTCILDEAMERLGGTDRDALVLRYFQKKSLLEVGVTLGLTEEAARKRVARGLEKLRRFFAKRGIAISASALAGAMTASSVQAAPFGLIMSVTAAATEGFAVSGSTLTFIDGALKLMAWKKTQMATAVAAAILLVGVTATMSFLNRRAPRTVGAVPSNAPAQLVVDAITRPANPAPPEAALESGAKPKGAPAAAEDARRPLVYPTAPRMSAILAEVRAATGGTLVPADRVVQNQYGNLFQKLQLTTDQVSAFAKILIDRQAQSYAAAPGQFQLPIGALSDDEMVERIQAQKQRASASLQTIDEAAGLQIKELLGTDDNFKYYQTYSDQSPERDVVINAYADGLDEAGVAPLTLDQQEQLVNVLYRARVSDDRDAQTLKVPEILQEASTLLTADQVKVLERYMKEIVAAEVTGARTGRKLVSL
jgi:RNA polymerase sigma factor (sigma-70 family)